MCHTPASLVINPEDGVFLGKILKKVIVYSRSEIPTLLGRDREEGSGRVCSGLGFFLGFEFMLKLSEFGSLQDVFS